MKKVFTLAALGLLTAGAFSAQAQTLDGKVQPAEGYLKIGEYKSTVRGFGDHGLASLYAKTTATKVYIALVGALEANGNSFQVYMNLPNKTGAPITAKLPTSSITGTSFEKAAPTMEMEVDYGFGAKGGPANSATSIIDYTSVTAGKAKDQLTGDLPIDGTVKTVTAGVTGGLDKTRMAFLNKNTLTAHTGIEGWEIELDKADLGITNGAIIQLFAAQNGGDGGFFSSDVIPEVTGNTAPQTLPIGTNKEGNFATDPNFTTLPGVQFISYAAVVTSSQSAVASALKFSVFPNPAAGAAKVSYTVPGQQEVSVEVFNALGQRVRSLASGRQGGLQEQTLNDLASGAYFVKLQVGGQSTSQKLIVQ
ncbi:T9SS type A sorting domain-containing protein [Hymenobacter sp. ISL-91]|uniref:T9SS type A sorting domain-containing protein n=1 Tax=Hymenobacter sp. ISL-91 TaxID=2819151 RepID=UPI001BEBAF45|nr:T9SS type A sorting domain-containing protein [Hymenobacter sp. ISL-91]MBT2558167.1 T9SS type A sorting domain-containing protein [Hymenobacter sp. ISL-91]